DPGTLRHQALEGLAIALEGVGGFWSGHERGVDRDEGPVQWVMTSVDVTGLTNFTPGNPLQVVLHHKDGTAETIMAQHSYNAQQIEWFKAGGALNVIRSAAGK
ncbi:MAG: hypothetical protein ACKO03_01020, partial [Bacteroidota bacterium]